MAPLFEAHHRKLLAEAVVIAEDRTSDFFKLSPSHWRRARYDILTLKDLLQDEISPHALALVAKYRGCPTDRFLRSAEFDFYRVCLQDHNILKNLREWGEGRLFPVLTYIMTHELVHIVRFSTFAALYDAPKDLRAQEEREVHRLTREILAPLNFIDLPVGLYHDDWQGGWQYAHL